MLSGSKTVLQTWFRIAFALALLCAWALQAGAGSPVDFGLDLHGNPVRQLAGPGTRVVVLIFAASDCPISNRYVPEVARLNREFSGKGVRFWWVFPNPDDTAKVVAQHNRDFSIPSTLSTTDVSTVLDRRQSLVAWAHAGVAPEAAVFVVEGAEMREVYHGRIDDRYIDLGQERPQAGHHDLEMAISATLAGKPAPQPGGPTVGCSIVFLQK
ncbi:MAG: redoxin family protein [Terracidiphilus sp.]